MSKSHGRPMGLYCYRSMTKAWTCHVNRYRFKRMKTCSSREAAARLGISLMTLQRYIAAKKIQAPKLQVISGIKLRLWNVRDIERVRKQMKAN